MFAILLILLSGLKKRSQQNNGTFGGCGTTFMSCFFRFALVKEKHTHRLMSSVDYGFNQWSVASFLIKQLYVYIFMMKLYIFSYTHVLHANIFSPFMI